MELRVLSTRPWICLEGEDPAHWLASIWDRSIQRQTFVPASSSHLSRSVLDWLRNTWPRSRINLIPNLSRPLSSLPTSPTSHVDVSSKTSLQPNPTFPEYVGPPTLPVFALFQSFSVFFFPSPRAFHFLPSFQEPWPVAQERNPTVFANPKGSG